MKYKQYTIALAVFLCVAFASSVAFWLIGQRKTQGSNAALRLARGKYLVEAVAICFECHSERDYTRPGWPIPSGMAGGGRVLFGEGTSDQLIAPNISPDVITGIGSWSDSEIARAITEGIARDGHLLNPEMPYRYYRSLSKRDLESIIAYLRFVPPVSHSLLPNKRFIEHGDLPKVAMDSIHVSTWSGSVRRGEYLVRIAACETCHTPTKSNEFLRNLEFAGGTLFQRGTEIVASSNLTPDPSGIAYYDESTFIEAMRKGMVGTRKLSPVMPWLFYGKMSTEDTRALFSYLRSIPPVHHRVDNGEPRTLCKKCRNVHGAGDQN